MGINIGLDIGAISLKLAASGKPGGPADPRNASARPSREFRLAALGGRPLVLSDYRRIAGSPIQSTYDLLQRVLRRRPRRPRRRHPRHRFGQPHHRQGPGPVLRKRVQSHRPHDRRVLPARAHGVRNRRRKLEVHPAGRTATSWITTAPANARPAPARSSTSRRCACSTRSRRSGDVVCTAGCAARIAGRCSVFAKSDMIHAQQKGYSPAEILRGLCDAVARNFKSGIVKGRPVRGARGADRRGVAERRRHGARCARRSRWPRTTCSCRRALRLVRRHRHGHPGSRGAAQALHAAKSTG